MITALLRHPRLPAMVTALAVVLALPAMFAGYQADDWFHVAEVRGVMPLDEQREPAQSMFSFFDGDPARTAGLRDRGIVPWWVDDRIRASFWRPVTVWTHQLDDAVAPLNPVFAHAHSIAWFALLVFLAATLFRRIQGGDGALVAGLAALLFAVDEAHGLPVGWLANRNSLISGVLGFTVLLLYDLWRRDDARWAGWLAPPVFALSLFSAEAALASTAYLFAYALFLDRGTLLVRALRLVPYGVIVVAWRVAYGARGFGTEGSGLYLDPVREPLRYAPAALERIPMLLADQLLNFPSMVPSFMPPTIRLTVSATVAIAVLLFCRLLYKRLGDSPALRFWVLGGLLATLPIAATFPMPRLLVFVSLGGSAVLASFILHARESEGWTRRVGTALIVLHVGVAALSLPVQAYLVKPLTETMFPCEEYAVRGPEAAQRTAIYVNSNDLCVAYVPIIRAVHDEPSPRVLLLSSALYAIELVGVDERTLEVHVPAGMHSNPADSLLRNPMDAIPVGEAVITPEATFVVQSHSDAGLVDVVRVTFTKPLTDPSYQWICTVDRVGVPCAPPAPGETIEYPAGFTIGG